MSVESFLVPSNIHPVLHFTNRVSTKYNIWNARLLKIKDKEILFPRQVDWYPLEEAGLANNLRHTLTQSVRSRIDGYTYDINDWERLFAIKEPIYRELVLEFFSTVEMYRIKSTRDILLYFRLGGEDRNMSLLDVADALQIYTSAERYSGYFDQFIMEGECLDEASVDLREAWAALSNHPYSSGMNYSSNLTSVDHRLIQKFLAHSIACRGKNTEKVTVQDLWYLQRFVDRTRMSIPHCVAESLNVHGAGRKQPSRISGGHYVTLFAKFFRVNLRPRSHPYTLVPDTSSPISYEMYQAAHAVSKERGKFVLWRPTRQQQRQQQQQQQQEDSDSEEEPVQQPQQTHTEAPSGSQTQHAPEDTQPSWVNTIMSHIDQRFDNIDLTLENYRERTDYQFDALNYRLDWQMHNTERLYDRTPGVEMTHFHQPPPPPQWGQPGGMPHLAPYDRYAALGDLQEFQERQQQGWDRSWEDAYNRGQGDWQHNAADSWFSENYDPNPTYDASRDYHQG